MRLWKPHDLGRSYLRFTIRHHVTNETDSQNAGALHYIETKRLNYKSELLLENFLNSLVTVFLAHTSVTIG